jgi:lipopolysaccharide biosynthesis regulator YciM
VTDAWIAIAAVSLAVVAVLLADRLRRRRDEAQAYLKGVRSVISGDPDAAIEALSDAARLGSPQAVETYLALGQLFRREGDLSRAVRLHRNMLMGPVLDAARRAEVERELAEDYRRSGMLQEAGDIYRRLAPSDPAAAEGLRDVLLDGGDLAGAIEVQRRLGRDGADPVLAHLLAAQARGTVALDARAALTLAREAVEAVRSVEAPGAHADAFLALAESSGAAGDPAAALEAAGRALDADPRAALLAWPALAAMADPAAAVEFVDGRLSAEPAEASLHFLHGRALHRAGRNPEAFAAVRRALDLDRTGETTLAMRALLREADAPGPAELPARHELLVIALRRRARPPRCARCGADAPTRSWRCKRCGAFDAYP